MSANMPERPNGGLQARFGYADGQSTGHSGQDGREQGHWDIPQAAGATLGARIAGFVIDWVILLMLYGLGTAAAAILGILTLGLLWGPLVALLPLLPLAYHTAFLASPRHATPGQALMGLRAVSVTDPEGPGWVQALITVLLFYAGLVLTSGLILVWALFDDRSRCLHDILSGTRMVRDGFAGATQR